ncbi:dienelactone hydrolase family protein [Paenibacillus sp. N4]|uniref:dienelactone hydrolase family protein n=1 Tax=Paenibacillus vietnamensis TaxID=2590547 RepID=UPI001CD0ACD2|nr:alpha/beta hydrolase family protein [Paenibacillus vietnamensis]MCA0758094.1 dienelactone hydrolase family protein [Paenibacillus vietnamensis]
MWNGDAWLEKLYEEAIARHRRQAKVDLSNERRPKLKAALREAIGSFEPNPGFVPRLLERVECDGYVRERVELSATPELTFAAYVLLPKDAEGLLPGVLALHGHGYGSREIVGLLPDGSPDEGVPGIHQHFAVQLVKRGLAVIAPDVIGFGERKLLADLASKKETPSSCHKLSTQLMMLGKTLTGLRVTEALKAFNYLASRPDVDGSRIGTMGFSGGGLIGYVAAVMEARIKAVVLTGFTNTFKESIFAVNHCIDNYTPGLLEHAELPELISLIAPRPLFLESGERDPIFPVEGFRRASAQIEAFYEAAGAGGRVEADVFPGKHEIGGRKAYDWLKETLASL